MIVCQIGTPIKLKPEKGSKRRAAACSRLEHQNDGRSFSLRGSSCFVSAHNFFGPGLAAWLLDTFLL